MKESIITDFCAGCRMCEQLCSLSAIEFLPDDEGFLSPVIDNNKCIGCQLCAKRCPQNREIKKNSVGDAFAIRLKDDSILKHSASGGAFVGLAKQFVLAGGYVAGVIYDESWSAVFKLTNNLSDIILMQSSKYLQADTKDIYGLIRYKLQGGNKVLFVGTACQVAGLIAFLNKNYDNLVTVDIICHGVTSPLMFRYYIKWLEEKKHSKIQSYNFRSKEKGWGLVYSYQTNNKKFTAPSYIDPYYRIFLKGDAYRECCYKCKYSSIERISDITIGDYWGIEEEHPSFTSTKGVSAILINTEKGHLFFAKTRDLFFVIESDPNKIAKKNENLLHPTKRNAIIRDGFYEGINSDSQWFEKVALKYKPSVYSKIKAKLPSGLRNLVKRILK